MAPKVNQLVHKDRCVRFNSTSSKVTKRVRNTEDLSKPINVLDRTEHDTVSEDRGGCGSDCACYGHWMFYDSNDRS